MAKNATTQPDDQNDPQVQVIDRIVNAEVKSLRPTERAILEMLTRLEDIATDDTAETSFTGDDLYRILSADTEDDMWEGDELPGFNAKKLSGTDLEIYGFDVKFSTDPEIKSLFVGPKSKRKMYLMVHSARLNSSQASREYALPEVGESFSWNTSARYIVAKLFWLQGHGRFDNGKTVMASIVGTPLGGGKSVEKLKPIGSQPVQGEPPF